MSATPRGSARPTSDRLASTRQGEQPLRGWSGGGVCAGLIASLTLLAGCENQTLNTFVSGMLGGTGGSGLTVLPPSLPVRKGEQRQFQVVGSDSVSAADIVSWHISSTAVAGTITQNGVFTALNMGTCTVWATYQVPSTDGSASRTATSNRVTFDVWPVGPTLNP